MQTIEVTGTVTGKNENQFQGNKATQITVEVADNGGYVNLSTNDDRYVGVKVGDSVRILVLDDNRDKSEGKFLSGKKLESQLNELVRELERGEFSRKTLSKAADESWAKKSDPEPVICGMGGILGNGPFSPGTK